MHDQKNITDALLKFVAEHKHPNERCINIIKDCSSALHNGDQKLAYELYEIFRNSCGLGHMGCFDDVTLAAVYEHEDLNYVDTLFRSLLIAWSINMNQLASR